MPASFLLKKIFSLDILLVLCYLMSGNLWTVMKINGILWLEDIVEKLLQKHRVEKHEVREILQNRPLFRFVEKGHRKGENVYSAFGQTETGRYLVVYFIYKKAKQALVLSARNMTSSERRKYEQN